MSIIKTLILILLSLLAIKLIKFAVATNKTLKQTKTKGIGPEKILWVTPTFVDEVVEWTQVPGNLNEAGFHHLWLGPMLGVLAAAPEAHKLLLTHKTAISKNFANVPPSLMSWMNHNVVTADGDNWRRQRTSITPAFKTDSYRQYYPTFVNMTKKLLAIFEAEGQGKDISLLHLMKAYTIDTLGHTVFHYDFNCLSGKDNEYYDAYNQVMTNGFANKIFLVFPWLDYLPYKPARDLRAGKTKLTELFLRMIDEHRRTNNYKEVDVLTNMLHALDQPELEANLFILFLAGHDTTSSALVWAVLELAKRPEIQTKLRVEILKVIGNSEPTLEQLNEIPYLEWFINEVLRFHPPVPIIFSRSLVEDIHCEGGSVIPKDTLIGLNIVASHFHPDHWVNPTEFSPERFSPANSKGRHKFAFLPFSAGPRQCIGMAFSMIEQKLFLIRLLQTFQVYPPGNGLLPFGRDTQVSVDYPKIADVRFKKISYE